jgi:predicted amidophosphoribosyltransferase
LPAPRLLAATDPHDDAPVELDWLVPVPLGPGRLGWRGFNQSLQLARACARQLAATRQARPVPAVAPQGLRRVRETAAQSRLDLADRARNLEGCFGTPRRLDGLRIGLVDDVMTTGSTLAEAARTLKRAGASAVVNLVVARTA